jgi:Dyp-type peroxidase family
MMPIDLNTTHIDPTDPYYHPLLDDLQGNILKGHGRNHSIHLFVQFRDAAQAKSWMSRFADEWVTSAIRQYQDARRYKMDPEKYANTVLANLMLTAEGYRALGIDDETIPKDRRFRLGMKHNDVRSWLHDPPVEDWEVPFQQPVHALVILACNLDPRGDNRFAREIEGIRDEIRHFGEIVHTEYGKVLRENGDSGQAIEHFGYVDGVSQPLVFGYDIEKAKERGGRGLWDPSAPLSLLVTPDPLGRYPDSCGSYFVYRKYQQDVDRFHTLVRDLSEHLDVDMEYAGALVFGRFRDGTPLVQADEPQRSGPDRDKPVPNNFTYDRDRKGRTCPFHAHMRKVNPRGEKHDERGSRILLFLARFQWLRNLIPALDNAIKNLDRMERARRIARRGISYGDPEQDEEVGLLFLCAQSDIGSQFEFIQNAWSNKNTFLKEETGIDPVIGQGVQQDGGQWWPTGQKGADKAQFDFRDCIQMRGGEYFFATSISFLTNL